MYDELSRTGTSGDAEGDTPVIFRKSVGLQVLELTRRKSWSHHLAEELGLAICETAARSTVDVVETRLLLYKTFFLAVTKRQESPTFERYTRELNS